MTVEMLTYPKMLLLVFATLFVVTFLTLLTVRRRLSVQHGEMKRLMTLIATQDPVETDDSETGDPIESVTEALTRLSARLDALGMQQQASVVRGGSLDDGAAMARSGASAAEIATRAGISVGEAELLLRVHGSSPTPD
ncbi:MAG: DUF2802 domain-containing protein [Pseudomonadota bacterium]